SSNDVWAVGYYSDGSTFRTLTEHWDGATWSVVPNPGTGHLNDVAAISSNDVRAVGGYYNGGGTFTMHWDGTQWSVVSSPNPGGYSELWGVTAISSNDVWAVGWYSSGAQHSLTMHWDGSTWSVVPSPNQESAR